MSHPIENATMPNHHHLAPTEKAELLNSEHEGFVTFAQNALASMVEFLGTVTQ